MKYGKLIKERRTVLGMTQQDLSDYTELSLRIIKSIESEKGNPSKVRYCRGFKPRWFAECCHRIFS